MNFGKYAVIQPVSFNFEEEPDWSWTFRPPTSKDELELQAFLLHSRSITVGGRTETHPPTMMEIAFEEIALTFGGTTIPKFRREDGEWVATDKPLLSDNASKQEIKKVLGEMPTEMVLEIWNQMGKLVPNWGPRNDDPKE